MRQHGSHPDRRAARAVRRSLACRYSSSRSSDRSRSTCYRRRLHRPGDGPSRRSRRARSAPSSAIQQAALFKGSAGCAPRQQQVEKLVRYRRFFASLHMEDSSYQLCSPAHGNPDSPAVAECDGGTPPPLPPRRSSTLWNRLPWVRSADLPSKIASAT